MSKVITFSRTFPAYHPKAGHPTNFVEKILQSLSKERIFNKAPDLYFNPDAVMKVFPPKYHTIRSGNRFKVGDKFSPRIWSGKPYLSKQIIIAPDIEIKKVWNFEIKNEFQGDGWYNFFYLNGKHQTNNNLEIISKNDGLTFEEMVHWFKANDGFFSGKEYKCNFKGQIICWNENIYY